MSEQPSTDAPETGEAGEPTEPTDEQPKPAETVDFWRQKAREQEKRAKENAAAAKKLTELEEAQKSEAEKAQDRIAKAEAEVEAIPARVSDALRTHLVELHEISADDAELFLTATDPELLLKQVNRLVGRSKDARKGGNNVPAEGRNFPTSDSNDAAFAQQLLSG